MTAVDPAAAVSAVRPVEQLEVAPPPPALANPAPLGLLGYGMTTTLLSLANAGLFTVDTMILAMAVFFGGTAQMIVAILAFRRGETFSVTAFGGFAFLWLTYAFILVGSAHAWGPSAPTSTAVGWYLMAWAVFSVGMMIGSFSAPRVLTGVLALTVALLAILSIANWLGSDTWTKVGGWEGIVTGLAAIYTAFGFLFNESLGRTVLPVGAPLVSPRTAATPPRQRVATP
jgi:succinate-acetate transporter protein